MTNTTDITTTIAGGSRQAMLTEFHGAADRLRDRLLGLAARAATGTAGDSRESAVEDQELTEVYDIALADWREAAR